MTSALMAISLLAGCNKHTHEWGEVVYTWSQDNKTCTAERVCKGDESHKETETANSTYVVVDEAKCEVDGKGKYSVTFENEAFAAQTKEVKIDALEHDYQFAEFVWADDYSAQAKYVCSHDANHVQLHDATVTSQVTTEPGCETEGVRTYSASYDGHSDTKTAVIPAKDHSWGEPTYVWAEDNSTCTATRVCLNDEKHTETETVETTYKVITPATCEEGLGRYTTNVFQNAAFSVQTKDVAIPGNHNWGEPTYVWSENYSSCTATRVCEVDSTHVETETVNSTYKVETEATTEQEGKGVYTATFTNEDFEEQTKDVTLPKDTYATKPHLSSDGKTVTYGIYPQTVVDDEELITSLNDLDSAESNGWYLYESEYYAKVSATPYNSSYVFDNGTTIVSGTTYWFKCEPIVWNVLSNNSGEYYIVSSVLLDAHCYYNSLSTRTIDGKTVYANNYKYSDIRTWLNADFYNSAFALGNEHIRTTTVNNSASTTNSSSNSYACANTEDKVFLPSYQDYINSSYGFSTSTGSTNTRYCKTTDWARARGAWYSTSSSKLYNGYYWTRSPRSGESNYAWYLYFDGNLYGNYVYNTYHSVRPGLSITIA